MRIFFWSLIGKPPVNFEYTKASASAMDMTELPSVTVRNEVIKEKLEGVIGNLPAEMLVLIVRQDHHAIWDFKSGGVKTIPEMTLYPL